MKLFFKIISFFVFILVKKIHILLKYLYICQGSVTYLDVKACKQVYPYKKLYVYK